MKKARYITMTLLLLSLLFIISQMSPLYDVIRVDEDIFGQLGLLILNGGTPYIDLFDHKGPIIFFIYAFGELIHFSYGVFILQVLNLLLSFFIWYKSARLICNRKNAVIASFCSAMLFLAYIEGGAVTEEFNILPVSIPLYFYVKAYKKGSFTLSRFAYLISGVCIGFCLMTRMNNMVLIAGLALYLVVLHLVCKEYKELLKALTFVILGIALLFLPILAFFYAKAGNDGLYQLYFGTLAMNLEYMLNYKVEGLSQARNTIIFAPFVLICCLAAFKYFRDKDLIRPLGLSFLIGMATMGGALYRHYFVVLVPVAFFAMVILMRTFDKRVTFGLILLCCCPLAYSLSLSVASICRGDNRVDFTDADRVFGKMQNKESVYNYNAKELGFSLLLRSGYTQCNRVFLPFQLQVSATLAEQEKNSLERIAPRWVFLERGGAVDATDRDFIESNYSLFDSISVRNYPLMYVYERSKED